MIRRIAPGMLRAGACASLLTAVVATSCRFDYEIVAGETAGSGGSLGGDAGVSSGGNSGGGATAGTGGIEMMAEGGMGGALPSCMDGERNGTETDIDCGGAVCPPCALGQMCLLHADCESGLCEGQICMAPSCTDGVLNQGEEGIDCGGPNCPCCSPGVFSAPEKITGLGLVGGVYGPALSRDALTLYVAELDINENIFVATRPDRGVAFSVATNLTAVNSTSLDGTPLESTSGLALYFFSDRPGTMGSRDLMVATRDATNLDYGTPSWLANLNSTEIDQAPTLSSDELRIIFGSPRTGTVGAFDLWIAERPSIHEDFSTPENLAELNTAFSEDGPSFAADELTIFFVSNRTGSQGFDVWMASRTSRQDPFGEPVLVEGVNSPADELDSFISADGRELFFSSNVGGSFEIWRAVRECL